MTPVEVEAVAAAIKIPEIGANKTPGMWLASTPLIKSCGRFDEVIVAPIAPAPIKIKTTSVIRVIPTRA